MIDLIAPISFGLGDLVVSLPAIQGLIRAGRQAVLVARAAVQEELSERISNLAGCVRESELESNSSLDGNTYCDLREHPLQRNYWWGSAEFARDYPGYYINDILRRICQDKGIPADFESLHPLAWCPRPDFAGKVVLIPGSDGPYKCWPAQRWMKLCDELGLRGFQCAMVGQPERSLEVRELVEAGVPWLPTPGLGEALDAISSSAAVVGVDTGLSHVAVQQGIPTVVLYTRLSVFVRPYRHCFPLFAPDCGPACRDRFLCGAHNFHTVVAERTEPSWSCCLPHGSSCMSKIGVEQVLEIMLRRDFQDRMSAVAGRTRTFCQPGEKALDA